jgi:toxin secretion/phage lysis holin
MKKKASRFRVKRTQKIRFWIVYGCTVAFVAFCGVLGYGFARDQKEGPLKTLHAIGKIAAAAFAAVCSWFVGLDNAIRALLIMAAVDYGTGIIMGAFGKSKKTESGRLSSRVGFKGIGKKMAMFGIVGLGAVLDTLFGEIHMVRNAFAIFYCVNELLSICEHARMLNVPIPPINNILGKVLDQNGIKLTDKSAQPDAATQNKKTEGTGIG